MALYWSFLLPSFVCLAFTCFNQCFLNNKQKGRTNGSEVLLMRLKIGKRWAVGKHLDFILAVFQSGRGKPAVTDLQIVQNQERLLF